MKPGPDLAGKARYSNPKFINLESIFSQIVL